MASLRPPPTVRDIARAAGVSPGTVSRALKNQPGLTEHTRQQVLAAAQHLGYDFGKLRPIRLRRVSFLLDRQNAAVTSNPFYFPVLHGVEEACRSENVSLSYASLSPGEDVAALLNLQEPDAVVIAGYLDPALLSAIRRTGRRVVLVDHFNAKLPCVNSDNYTGGYLATQHLIAAGRARVAFIGGPAEHYSIQRRQEGYEAALRDAGRRLAPELIVRRDPPGDEEGTVRAVHRLLALREPPDALFAYNDATALRAIRVLKEAGLSVPGDVAVVGFDDLVGTAHASPALTTVHVEKELLGREAVHLLTRGGESGEVLVPVRLVLRASSRPRTHT